MLTIYSAQGVILLEISSIGMGSKGYYSLMQHDYIVLNFSLQSPIDFGIGSYVDLTGQFDDALGGKLSKKYYVTEKQTPTYNATTGGYDYELRFNAYYWLWNNYIFKYTPESAGSEASWSLTAALDVHLGVFLRNLSSLGFTFNGQAYTYSIDGTVQNKAVAMTYDNVHLLDALFSLGGKDYYDCDVWITENVIHFGRCELGTSVKIERGVEAQDITRSDSKGTFATRIYAFGSTRNIPTNYRPVDEQMVVNGVVQKRLMLPQGTPYIDAYPNMSQTEVIEDIVVFDDIYPRRVGTLQNVTSRTETVENEDGTQSTYTYYRYKDSGLTFDEDYILEGQNLQVTFQSGKLNGMTFGVTFNPDGASPAEQLWEIVGNEDYGRFLPDETIKPEDGDEYILSGFNIQLVSDQYIPAAEQELLQKAQEYVNKTKVDDGTYTATLRSDWVFADQIHRTFDVGQKITLVAPDFFTDNRVSRVIGWEMNLDIPYDSPIYTIGESAQYSRLNDIEEKVDTVTFRGNTYTGIGGSGIYIVRTNDRTSPSDSNVFSALRSLSQFLRKDKEDSTRYLLSLFGGAVFGADGFAGGMSGFGARIDDGGNGEMRGLTLWEWLTVPELRYNRVEVYLGIRWNTPGAGIVLECTPDTDADGNVLSTGRCRLKLEDGEVGAIALDDICMGIFHSEVQADNSTEDKDDSKGNFAFAGFATSYFRITGVTGERDDEFTYALRPGYTLHPRPQMHFSCYGNFSDTSRQSSMYQTRSYIRMLVNQNTWEIGPQNIRLQIGDLANLNVHELSANGYGMYGTNVYFTGEITQVKPDGTPVRTANDRGAWEAGKYDYYDRVSHDGCIWLCVAEDGTESEPSKNSADWLLQVDKGADGTPGTPGEPGKDGAGIDVKGSVKAHFKNFAALTAGGTGAQDGDKFILDDSSDYSETSQGETQEGYAAPSVMGYWNMPDFTWSVAKAAAGDCYTDEATGHMWVAGETAWTDAGKVKGDDGAEGDGGVSISLSGSPLAINASEINADMTGTRTWTARVRVYQGAEQTAVTGITLDNSYNNVVTASVDGGEGVVAFTANSENWAVALLYAFMFSASGIPFTVAYTDKDGTERTADGVVGVSRVQDGMDGADGKDVNANLLDDTDFISEARMSAWDKRDSISWQSGAEQTDDYAQSIQEGGPQGANYIHAGTRLTEEKIIYKEILQQDVGARLTPGEWHTLSFRARSNGGILTTYVYPSCVDASAGCYVDGVKQATVSSDGYLIWNLPDTWELHTFTFKAKAEFTAEGQYVLFRQMPPSAGGELVTIDISRPKLETGQAATAYMPGNTDMQGMDGCAVRTSEWAEGVEYRNDEGLATEGVRYLDVAMVRNDAAETGWDAYECLKTHTSSASLTYTNTEYWRKFGANVGAIFTSLIIAKNAKIRFLQGNSITVENEDGTVTAGMQGSAEGKKTRFWAGSAVPDEAPFMVDEEGKMTATDAEVNGIIHSRLTYSSVKRLMAASGYYTINPLQEAFNTLFITATADLFVTLPDADEYEGLELNIYQSVVTRTAMGTVVIKTAASLQEIYYSASTALINGVIVQTVNTEANHAESLVLTPNVAVKMVAVNGNWYVLTGVLTGE